MRVFFLFSFFKRLFGSFLFWEQNRLKPSLFGTSGLDARAAFRGSGRQRQSRGAESSAGRYWHFIGRMYIYHVTKESQYGARLDQR